MSIESFTAYASSERQALNKRENRHIVALFLTVLAVLSWLLVFGREDLKADEPYMPLVQESIEQNPNKWVVGVDLDKLWKAVALHESGLPGKRYPCATPWHKAKNNCVSIMWWPNGKRELKPYHSLQANKEAFKSLWIRLYGGGMPTLELAEKYSGKDQHIAWFENVTHFYNTL